MKGRMMTAASAAAFAAFAFASPAAAAQKIDNSYICVFKDSRVAPGQARAAAAAAANGRGSVGHVYSATIRGFNFKGSAQAVTAMRRARPEIAYCEQDQVATIGQRGKKGGGGTTTQPQIKPYGITRVNGGAAGTYGTAWIIDSGVDLDHPDLNVLAGINFTGERNADDGNGHGTHVAGTIAAIDNDIGVIGVAPGAPVVGLKALGRRGSGSYSDIIAAVDYVGANGKAGDVCNMSLGGGASSALDNAIIAASSRVVFSLAAGNESQDSNNVSPARVNGANIFTISAIDINDRFASFSNFGSPVDYAEPGVSVGSTYKDGGYATLSGTSMAAPHFAGLVLTGYRTDGRRAINDPDGNADLIALR